MHVAGFTLSSAALVAADAIDAVAAGTLAVCHAGGAERELWHAHAR